MIETTATTYSSLRDEAFISLVTFRKSGEGVPTPVWFALHGDRIYVMTVAESGKVKRIRNNGRVEFAPCDRAGKVHGPKLAGHARIIGGDAAEAADRALNRKYGWQKRLFDVGMSMTGTASKRVYLEIKALND
jgi:uncharacterized protein